MFKSPRPGYCASCEGAITGRPVLRRHEAFCCLGCLEGGPCICDYEANLAEDGVDRLGLLVPLKAFAFAESEPFEPVGPVRREAAVAGRR